MSGRGKDVQGNWSREPVLDSQSVDAFEMLDVAGRKDGITAERGSRVGSTHFEDLKTRETLEVLYIAGRHRHTQCQSSCRDQGIGIANKFALCSKNRLEITERTKNVLVGLNNGHDIDELVNNAATANGIR